MDGPGECGGAAGALGASLAEPGRRAVAPADVGVVAAFEAATSRLRPVAGGADAPCPLDPPELACSLPASALILA